MTEVENTQAEATTTVLPSLLAQKAELDKKIAKAKAEEKSAVLVQIRSAMEQYEITAEDLTAAPKRGRKDGSADPVERKPVAPKYRDEAGNTWTGRGKQPKWVAEALAGGLTIEDLLIEKPAAPAEAE